MGIMNLYEYENNNFVQTNEVDSKTNELFQNNEIQNQHLKHLLSIKNSILDGKDKQT